MMGQITLFKRVFIMALLVCVLLLLVVWANIGVIGYENLTYKAIPVKNKLCYVNLNDERLHMANKTDLKMIYFVTPTYPRPEQVPELTRLSHTLMHVPRIHWIIADDQPVCSPHVLNILKKSSLPYTHISSPKPYQYKLSRNFPRGVANRRAALSWLRENVREGILYFGDDDNTVDLQLFDEIRVTKKVSMFPVGLIGGYGVSSPVVKDGKVVGFFDSWPGSRTYPVDMAGFAVNIEFLNAEASMPYIAGHEEDRFLVSLGLQIDDIEPLASNCSRVLVWHTKTAKYKRPSLKLDLEKVDQDKYQSFVSLLKETAAIGMASIDPYRGAKVTVTRDRKSYDNLVGLL
ncbi:hypothetical protein ABMA28_000533 [Loxostege sticticalis]|uniref:Galactosylgalactosylxylosylprotein 3-beta-glucuronosyltransferase n=1 Tax=Loxostege sticticalis TaxID=481309 RepID=A0ABD0TSK4_LOXSC